MAARRVPRVHGITTCVSVAVCVMDLIKRVFVFMSAFLFGGGVPLCLVLRHV